MKDRVIHVLLIDRNPRDAFLVEKVLSTSKNATFHLSTSLTLSSGLLTLDESGIDVVLLDLDSLAYDNLHLIREMAPSMPILVLTNDEDEDVGINAVKQGAQDYWVKGQFDTHLFPRAIQYAIERQHAEVKLEKALREVHKSHDDLLSILNLIELGIVTIEQNGEVAFVNKTARDLIGRNEKEILGKPWSDQFSFVTHDEAWLKKLFYGASEGEKKFQDQVRFPSGRRYYMNIEIQDDPRDPNRKLFLLYDTSESYNLRRKLDGKAQFHDLLGKTEIMQSVFKKIQDVSTVDWTVLIEGETGTGKELVARAIHYSSQRKDGPFVAVNCAGLTDSLLSSQLFGHKRGAFTGAVSDQRGFFEEANGGTLFLDEIGDISHNLQTSLLRVLEAKEITRLGEAKPRKIDVRIVAATNRDLNALTEQGTFRSDLFYRLRVARIIIPPLRKRRQDIPILVASFLDQSSAETEKSIEYVSNEAMNMLLVYEWPGNVRELKSAIDFATLHCQGTFITTQDLPPEISSVNHKVEPVPEIPKDEKQRILEALERTNGNKIQAAKDLGMSRATLYRRMASLGIQGTAK